MYDVKIVKYIDFQRVQQSDDELRKIQHICHWKWNWPQDYENLTKPSTRAEVPQQLGEVLIHHRMDNQRSVAYKDQQWKNQNHDQINQ